MKTCPRCKKEISTKNDFCSRRCFNLYHGVDEDTPVAKTLSMIGQAPEEVVE